MFEFTPTLGRAVLAGLAAMTATGALASAQPQLVVSSHDTDSRTVAVRTAGLNLADAHDRRTLQIRIERAARSVCDVNGGSKLDAAPDAVACLADARAGALDQLRAQGFDIAPRLALR